MQFISFCPFSPILFIKWFYYYLNFYNSHSQFFFDYFSVLEEGAMVFRGIPYARPPIEDRRWKKPEPFTLKTCWSGVLKAHDAKDTCWQIYSNSTINGNENCLTLDIITPQVRYINPLPVSISFVVFFTFH